MRTRSLVEDYPKTRPDLSYAILLTLTSAMLNLHGRDLLMLQAILLHSAPTSAPVSAIASSYAVLMSLNCLREQPKSLTGVHSFYFTEANDLSLMFLSLSKPPLLLPAWELAMK